MQSEEGWGGEEKDTERRSSDYTEGEGWGHREMKQWLYNQRRGWGGGGVSRRTQRDVAVTIQRVRGEDTERWSSDYIIRGGVGGGGGE